MRNLAPVTDDDDIPTRVIDAGQITTGQLAVARVATGTATDGYVPTVTSGSLVLAAPSGGATYDAILMTQVFS